MSRDLVSADGLEAQQPSLSGKWGGFDSPRDGDCIPVSSVPSPSSTCVPSPPSATSPSAAAAVPDGSGTVELGPTVPAQEGRSFADYGIVDLFTCKPGELGGRKGRAAGGRKGRRPSAGAAEDGGLSDAAGRATSTANALKRIARYAGTSYNIRSGRRQPRPRQDTAGLHQQHPQASPRDYSARNSRQALTAAAEALLKARATGLRVGIVALYPGNSSHIPPTEFDGVHGLVALSLALKQLGIHTDVFTDSVNASVAVKVLQAAREVGPVRLDGRLQADEAHATGEPAARRAEPPPDSSKESTVHVFSFPPEVAWRREHDERLAACCEECGAIVFLNRPPKGSKPPNCLPQHLSPLEKCCGLAVQNAKPVIVLSAKGAAGREHSAGVILFEAQAANWAAYAVASAVLGLAEDGGRSPSPSAMTAQQERTVFKACEALDVWDRRSGSARLLVGLPRRVSALMCRRLCPC
eukprot:GHVT01033069.1.p1 GENE.GHVT01033069.1~~GHVT01033069.1.p1  ORF type:complete len:468 (+),score=109.95 GHVT01033069.1:1187-2590(+)